MHGALAAALRAPWLRDPLWTRARMVPALDLRFADTQILRDWVSGRDLVTFTRASNGTRVTSAGTIETLGNDVPRFTFDPVTGRCLGLLVEEARTNLLLNSATLSTQSVSVTATAHTLHFTGTGTVTLSGTSTAGPLVGTGTGEANRVSLTFTPSAGTLTLTVSGTVSNAQLEAGSFRTSWIPTTGLAATRAADIATITGANFSSWYRQDEFSVYAEHAPVYTGNAPTTAHLWQVYTAANATHNYAARGVDTNGSGRQEWILRNPTAGLTTALLTGLPTATAGRYRRTAFSQNANSYGAAADGALATGSNPASAAMAAHDILAIGSGTGGTPPYQSNSTISRMIWWPRRLPDHILQELIR